MLIQVTKEKLDIEAATTAISNDAAGAVNIFLGIVRNNNKGREVSYLVYDAYPQMAEKENKIPKKEPILIMGFGVGYSLSGGIFIFD